MKPNLILVVAAAENGVIGHNNQLLWRLKTDLKRFRQLTWGKPMIMGRKTFESIGKPLPGRETIVLTRDRTFAPAGVHVAHSWEDAKAEAGRKADNMGVTEIAIVGGGEIYALALPEVQKIFLTQVHAAPEGDVTFPHLDRAVFKEMAREDHPAGPDDEHPFTFIDLVRAL